jgi:hypothetical protein
MVCSLKQLKDVGGRDKPGHGDLKSYMAQICVQ